MADFTCEIQNTSMGHVVCDSFYMEILIHFYHTCNLWYFLHGELPRIML